MQTELQPNPKARRRTTLKPLAAAAILAVTAGAFGLSSFGNAVAAKPAANVALIEATSQQSTSTAGALGIGAPGFSRIVAEHGAAVVNITVKSKAADDDDNQAQLPFDPDSLPEFFRRFGAPESFGKRGPRRGPVGGEGSGFIVSQDGIVLTNAHVVDQADEVVVKLTDRREYTAKVLGADKRTDVAVLKIDAEDLPVVKFGQPDQLSVGEWVLAIGSPFGFDNTVTVGVVSAKGRSLPNDGLVPFIQTDVAVNPGNSGGPLFNTRGEVIGINSQIFSRSGGYQGVSFAIPIDLALKVRQQIELNGSVQHARLGVQIQEVNQALANAFGLPKPAGALVSEVMPDSPAARAGIETGDVIQAVGEREIISSGELPSLIGLSIPGSSVRLTLWRDGKSRQIDAELGGPEPKAQKRAAVEQQDNQKASLGLTLRPLMPQELERAGLEQGLAVANVSGSARSAGVRPGDVILSVNSTPVKSVGEIRTAVSQSKKSVALLLMRGTAKIYLPVKVS
ncbi:MAG: Do family serine endopeptidase [Burkholderiaceae bacterium]